MSYNVDHCEYVKGKLYIKRSEAARLQRKFDRAGMAEINFIDELDLDGDPDEVLLIEEPWWSGEHSGSTFDELKEILAVTTGEAIILFVWEGGDSQTALHVKGGKVTDKKVKAQVEDL